VPYQLQLDLQVQRLYLELDQVRKTTPQSGRYANEMYDRNSMEDLESLIQLGKIEMS
jgi:hypothetical protein